MLCHDHLPSATLRQSRSTFDPWRQTLGVGFWCKGLCQARTLETTCITYASVLYGTVRVVIFKMN
jgi:hypothetical protein